MTLIPQKKIGDALIYPGSGCAHTEVTFRMIVFRPFIGEIIVGKVRSCSRQGIKVSLEFFEDILIPPYLMQPGSKFDDESGLWVLKTETGDDEDGDGVSGEGEEEEEIMELPLDISQPIRFRVQQVNYANVVKSGKGTHVNATTTRYSNAACLKGMPIVPD